jgi:hypothetical protein
MSEQRPLSFLIPCMILLLLTGMSFQHSIIGEVEASSSSNYPTAYLKDWEMVTPQFHPCNAAGQNAEIPYNCDAEQVDWGLTDKTPFGVDDSGNQYYALAEDSATFGSTSISGRGIHIVKVNQTGQIEWLKSVNSSSSYCSYDNQFCGVMALKIVDEDEFYIVLSTYSLGALTFSSSVSIQSSGYQMIVAYHDASGWKWAEAQTASSSVSTNALNMALDGAGDLYVTLKGTNSGGYIQHSLLSYSSTGGKWVRTLEIPSNSASGRQMLFDTETSSYHLLILAYQNIRYDSQTTNCPSGTESGYCYVWLSIASNGAKIGAVAAKNPAAFAKRIEVVNSTLHILFTSVSDNPYTFSPLSDYTTNFTGTPSSCVSFCSHLVKLTSGGSWSQAKMLIDDALGGGVLNAMYFSDHGAGIFFTYTESANVIFDTVSLRQYTSSNFEVLLLDVDENFNYRWHNGIGFDDLDGLFMKKTEVGYFVFSVLNDGNAMYNSNMASSETLLTFLISDSNGTIFDVEKDFGHPIGTLPDGTLVMRTFYNPISLTASHKIVAFSPDYDNDNVGANDNCPDHYNPSQADYDSDGLGDVCDPDDDNDGINDSVDLCSQGLLAWLSNSLTDHDSDGCKDTTEEDPDDDNDGISDLQDDCPTGITGASLDYDADGCKNSEDQDDDNDGVNDGSDSCPTGELDWISGSVTDHDSDGCNDATEDVDDDNDGVLDLSDSCPKGEVNWPSNANTDFDGDGCKDGYEDEDDDGDGVPNFEDKCEDSLGPVNADGCAASQIVGGETNGGNENSTQTPVFYYVCSNGATIVTDLADCPAQDNNSNSNNTQPIVYYVCLDGSGVVTDLSLCPTIDIDDYENITYIIDPESENTGNFKVCPSGTVIVIDLDDCPTSQENNNQNQNSGQDTTSSVSSTDSTILFIFAGLAMLLAMGAFVLVLVRKPGPVSNGLSFIDQGEAFFKEQPELPSFDNNVPPRNLTGKIDGDFEWVEYPAHSETHWYRTVGGTENWKKYQN